MRAFLPLLLSFGLGGPAAAEDDPWGLGDTDGSDASDDSGDDGADAGTQPAPLPPDSPWSGAPTSSAPPAPAPPAPPAPPTVDPAGPGPVSIPVREAPAGFGYTSQQACRAAWQADRGWVQRLTPTWRHPSVERCQYAAGADRWSIVESPASMVLTAAVDLPLIAGSTALVLVGRNLDVVANGRENWDLTSDSVNAAAGTGSQRRDPLPDRTSPDLGAREASDWLLYGSLAGAALAPVSLPPRNGRITNTVVMAEILALQYGVQQVVSGTVAEPRPIVFQQMQTWTDEDFASAGADLTDDDDWRSYYSGHTSTVAAVSYGYATIYAIDALDAGRPSAGLTLLLIPTAFMLTNLQGQLRVDSLRHDQADVWIGHLAGASIGMGVPLLHHLVARSGRSQASPAPVGRLTVTPTLRANGFGLDGRW